jgi:hypothetical protein
MPTGRESSFADTTRERPRHHMPDSVPAGFRGTPAGIRRPASGGSPPSGPDRRTSARPVVNGALYGISQRLYCPEPQIRHISERVWTRNRTRPPGGEPAGPSLRLGSPPGGRVRVHAQPSLIYATNFRSGTLAATSTPRGPPRPSERRHAPPIRPRPSPGSTNLRGVRDRGGSGRRFACLRHFRRWPLDDSDPPPASHCSSLLGDIARSAARRYDPGGMPIT